MRFPRPSGRRRPSSLIGFCATALIASLAVGASVARADAFIDGFESGANWIVLANGGNGVRFAGSMQTSYGWGEAARTFVVPQLSTVRLEIDVFNGNTNTIGSNVPTADRYLLSVGDQVLDTVQIHGWERKTVEYQTLEAGESVTVRLGGIDNGFWGGWYGPVFDNAVITIDPVTSTTPQPPEPPQNAVYGLMSEGGDLVLTAPGDATFTAILFASYGTPTGEAGNYQQGACHATDSVPTVAELVIGQQTATVPANNGVFGDPCPGTYKALAVVAQYAAPPTTTTTTSVSPTTTTTTTLPIPAPTTSTQTTAVPTTSTTEPPTSTTTEPPATSSTTSPEPTSTSSSSPQTSSTSTPSTTALIATTVQNVPSSTTTLLEPTTTPPVTLQSTTLPTVDSTTTTLPPTLEAPEPEPAVVLAELTTALEPTALQDATDEEIDALLEEVIANVDDLSPAQQELLAASLTAAPPEVKKAFEAKANVFAGGFDSYVPVGSTVSVRQRRALIAVAATFAAAPAATTRRRI